MDHPTPTPPLSTRPGQETRSSADRQLVDPGCVLLPVFETLATTFTILQARNMVISQQRHEMEALVGKVFCGIGARSSLDGSLEAVDPGTIVSNGDCA
jgi:hypothetical protein